MTFAEKTCTPCRNGTVPMKKEEAEAKLKEIPGWLLSQEGASIHKRFCFKDFASALFFANKVGECCEKEGHHPVLTIGWGYCTVTFMTNKIKGLHENDFIMASKVNALDSTG